MQIILLKDIVKIGQKFDIKNVSDGYAMNFLFPNNLAELATPKKIKNLETAKLQHEAEDKVHQELLLKNLKVLDDVRVKIQGKANSSAKGLTSH